MKTKLLLTCLLLYSFAHYGQTLDEENFNSLTLGDVGSDLTGATLGQGGFGLVAVNGDPPSTTTNASVANFQIVANGEGGTQGLQHQTPNGDAGVTALFKFYGTTLWGTRDSGNNIAQLGFDFFTGPASSSEALVRVFMFGDDSGSTEIIVGFQYEPATRKLSGLARLISGGNPGLFIFDLAFDINDNPIPLFLDADTWYSMGLSYDQDTGLIRWKTSFNNTSVFFNNINANIPGLIPNEVDFLAFGVDGNSSEATLLYDNYLFDAASADTLSDGQEVQFQSENNQLIAYPNPANNVLNIQSDNKTIDQIDIYNTLGQKVMNKQGDLGLSTSLDISALDAGIYMINVKSQDNSTQVLRFVKQ